MRPIKEGARRVASVGVISPPPDVLVTDLADAALGCTALNRARKLAEWVGPGRELTSSGVLRPAVAAEACRALGIRLPGARLRSALDVDELMQDWTVAMDAGLVVADGRRACAVPDLAGPDDPELVLAAWVQAAVQVIGGPDEPCAACLTMLHELYAYDGPLDLDELAGVVAALESDAADTEPCAHCGEVHDSAALLGIGGLLGALVAGEVPGELDDRAHAEGMVEGLAAFGAAVVEGGAVRLTSLGSMLAAVVFDGSAPAPSADAGELMSAISAMPPPVARTMAGPWLAARSPAAAVRELLACAEAAGAELRMAALAFAAEIGPEATDAWQECAERPGFGAYARQWLADQGVPVVQDPADEAWLTVDALSIMLEALPDTMPPLLLATVLLQETGDDLAEVLPLLRSSGHPAAAGIAARLTGRPDPGPSIPGRIAAKSPRAKGAGRGPASTGGGGAYQIKISLRGVSKPPVWRRVAVPADITLDLLHELILRVMGWSGDHLHVFSTGWAEYGSPDAGLGHGNEAAVRLLELLSGPGDKLRYTYDFGDDWDHDVVLEEVLPASPGTTDPCCLAGKGACPPEDCGGVWGYAELKEILADRGHQRHQDMLDWLGLDSGDDFDPKAFSVEHVNFRLGSVAPG
jgi:Plasmid pRiA4b ORF-3-like protein